MFNVNHVTNSVRDNIRSIEFYKKFGFKIIKSWQADDNSIKIDMLKLNNMILEIFCYKEFTELLKLLKTYQQIYQ